MTPEDIYAEINNIVNEETQKAEVYFKNAVLNSKLNLTGDLAQSVKSRSVALASAHVNAEISITFNKYWRYKDMRELSYDGLMHFEGMLNFVKKVGVEKFPWVNGYDKKATPTVPNAAERIARTLMWHRKKTPVVVHAKSRRKYNKTKNDFRTVIRRRLTTAISGFASSILAETLEKQ